MAAPGLWVKRIGLGEAMRARRRVQATAPARVRGAKREEERMGMPESVGAARTQSAPGQWAARNALATAAAGAWPVARVGDARVEVEERATRIGGSAGAEDEAAQAARMADASETCAAERIASVGGVQDNVSAGVGAAVGADAESVTRRPKVLMGDARAEQRARIEAVR